MKRWMVPLGIGSGVWSVVPAVLAANAPPPEASTAPPPRQIEGVGDVRWSESLGFVGPGAPSATPAGQSPVLDVPAKAGAPLQREPWPGQNEAAYRGRLGFVNIAMQPINYGVEDEFLDYATYGVMLDNAFLFPTGKHTVIPLELGMIWVFGGTDVAAEPGGPGQDLEVSASELQANARTGLDVRLLDAPSWEVRLGPRVGATLAAASVSAVPAEETSDLEAEFRWELGAQAAVTFEQLTLEPRWRLIKNPALDAHVLGVDATLMLSKGFGFFARYETRVSASGGFRYALGSGEGDVDSLGLAHLRGMPERNTIVLGITF